MTYHRRLVRSRLTRVLIESAQERFSACEVCWHSGTFDFADDVLAPLRLRKREAKRLFRALTCPSCDSTVNMSTRVVTRGERNLLYAFQAKRFAERYGSVLVEFRSLLIRYPMLGSVHPFAHVLVGAMRRARKTLLAPRIWYHSNPSFDGPALVPRCQEKATSAGRFHQIGQIALYLGDDNKTAAIEHKDLREPKPSILVRLVEVELLESVTVLDLRWGVSNQPDPAGHWILRNVVDRGFVSEPTDDSDKSCPQYRLPQYIGDLARQRGFRGILYDSTRPGAYNNPDALGHNLVLFHPIPSYAVHSDEVLEFAKPDYGPWSPERWSLRSLHISLRVRNCDPIRLTCQSRNLLNQVIGRTTERPAAMQGRTAHRPCQTLCAILGKPFL